MGLLSKLLLSPIKGPMDGALWVARKVAETAEAELNDPATLRKQLAFLEQELLNGRISEEDYEAAEEDILMRLKDTK